MAMTFSKPALVKFAGTSVTDHNRSQLGTSFERIETRKRMADGSMRKYYIADKRTFTLSWTDCPSVTTATVDGFLGGKGIYDFYVATTGSFVLTVANKDGSTSTYTVVVTSFTFDIKKRYTNEYWDINITVEEV